MDKKANILIIDDDETILDSCRQVLEKEGHKVKTAKNGKEGLRLVDEDFFHLVFCDLKMPGMDGMDVVRQIKEKNPEVPVVVITGFGSIESAVAAMKEGAFHYMSKPFSPHELRVITEKALENRKIVLENIYLRNELESRIGFDMVVGKSKVMQEVLNLVKQVSASDSTVLISGESGTGKEMLAREIHNHSPRKNGPFVVVDCGALVETLFESELFGHVKGSFTGAHETKHGRFEVANGGTVFLDEISNISLNIQAKLLRAIQEREVTRVGSSKPIKVDVRIIAATNEDLSKAVRDGEFREDLFYRLSVVPVHLPPLRQRKEDIPLLVEHFLGKYNKKTKKQIESVDNDILKALMEYDWPGNIRELENTIERAVVLSKGKKIRAEALLYHGISSASSFLTLMVGEDKSLEDIEKEYIKAVLKSHQGNKSQTAGILGIDRKTLLAKIKKFNIQ